jgi:hypothetical protein
MLPEEPAFDDEIFFDDDFHDDADFFTTRKNGNNNAEEILAILNDFGVPEQLKSGIYQFTNPIVMRQLHDMPALHDHTNPCCAFAIKPFFNHTHDVFYTRASPLFSSYLKFNDPTLIQQLEATAEEIGGIDFNIPRVLSIFSNIELQEFRVGFMFDFYRQTDTYAYRIQMPFYYQIHHFYLNDNNQRRLQD